MYLLKLKTFKLLEKNNNMKGKVKVGLNGLGRIGRHIFKMCINDPLIEIVGINETNPDLKIGHIL